jgi:exoribonuclease R
VPSTTVRIDADSPELTAALAEITKDLPRAFPPAVEAEAARVAAIAPLPELDRTEVEFVTIDPLGSTDLDQALHLARASDKHGGDGYRVLYAIADVPAFVKPDGAIDVEARLRGQTIYAADGRIPLHPAVLSEGAASLLAGQLRGAFVWDLVLDSAANVTACTVYRARVQSREQLDYATAQQRIDDGSASESLRLLKEVGLKRVALEQQRGGASLGTQETEVELHDGAYVLVRRSPHPVEDWNAQLSLMTGMAAATMMLTGGVGILRTMPPADDEAVRRFRRQTQALGTPWPAEQPYGDYLRSLDTADSRQLAIMHAATALFRGAGYSAFDGAPPEHTTQAAVAAPYAHVTAPLRRLVDRFGLVVCEALSAGEPVPPWVRDALPELPSIMSRSSQLAGQVDSRALNVVEAAVLAGREGEAFEATVLSAGDSYGTVQLADPPVVARCNGILEPGSTVSATLTTVEVLTGTVLFRA